MDAMSDLLDRQEVADVLMRYGSSLDERNWDRLSTCFVDDVTSVLAGGPEMNGYAQLEEAVRAALGVYEATQHHIADLEAEIDGDSATLRANLIATHLYGGNRFVVGGVYREELVRTAEGWRIAHHQLDSLWMDGG